jgi:hypothetical protein
MKCPWCNSPRGHRMVTCGKASCVRKQRTETERARRAAGGGRRKSVQYVPPSPQVRPWQETDRSPVFARLDAEIGQHKWRGRIRPVEEL